MPEGLTLKQRMEHKLNTAEGRSVYALRKTIPEPVFGLIKQARTILTAWHHEGQSRLGAGVHGAQPAEALWSLGTSLEPPMDRPARVNCYPRFPTGPFQMSTRLGNLGRGGSYLAGHATGSRPFMRETRTASPRWDNDLAGVS
jgi:hypothetical protein